uniref:C2H2-type domain-containing protein n=1 Tax=Trichobilharzia regenti TaxID=157069 RepID=A0AA85JVT6_TRIRE|nr:unnamed protein product [Trichobilharzia regenti]
MFYEKVESDRLTNMNIENNSGIISSSSSCSPSPSSSSASTLTSPSSSSSFGCIDNTQNLIGSSKLSSRILEDAALQLWTSLNLDRFYFSNELIQLTARLQQNIATVAASLNHHQHQQQHQHPHQYQHPEYEQHQHQYYHHHHHHYQENCIHSIQHQHHHQQQQIQPQHQQTHHQNMNNNNNDKLVNILQSPSPYLHSPLTSPSVSSLAAVTSSYNSIIHDNVEKNMNGTHNSNDNNTNINNNNLNYNNEFPLSLINYSNVTKIAQLASSTANFFNSNLTGLTYSNDMYLKCTNNHNNNVNNNSNGSVTTTPSIVIKPDLDATTTNNLNSSSSTTTITNTTPANPPNTSTPTPTITNTNTITDSDVFMKQIDVDNIKKENLNDYSVNQDTYDTKLHYLHEKQEHQLSSDTGAFDPSTDKQCLSNEVQTQEGEQEQPEQQQQQDEKQKEETSIELNKPKQTLYSCTICRQSFHSNTGLRRHNLALHATKAMRCDQCIKVFRHQAALSDHKKRVHGPREYICGICSADFATETYLRSHVRIHDEKRYICLECKHGFSNPSDLKNHMRIHNGEKPFECEIEEIILQEPNEKLESTF